ncbi:MAG: hypothetical protein IPP46_00980 [Bacteroidetes bacterium]|nr:hypothetical protein [Bacteroidota bacterium]
MIPIYERECNRSRQRHFIHGSCVTIGCLPMTDDFIKEIYLYAAYARQAGQQKIPVYVFPFKMNDENMQKHVMENMENALLNFWRNLKSGYDLFFSGKKKLNIRADREGHYLFYSRFTIRSANIIGNTYYIVIRHRNAIEVWSKYPVLFNSNSVNFDFLRLKKKVLGVKET